VTNYVGKPSAIDVRHHIQWRRHLVNAYEVKAGMVFFAG